MSCNDLIRLLSEHRDEYNRFDVKSLAVFGSVVRGEDRPDSDLDMLVEFKGTPRFKNLVHLAELLEEITGRKVDLVTVGTVKPRQRRIIQQDLVYVT